MIKDITDGSDTTCARARVNAFVSYTSFVTCALSIEYTFWSTTRISVSLVLRQARAYAIITDGITTAR